MIRKLLLLLALLVMPGVAHAEWYEVSSAHFVVYGNDSPERLKKFASDLERYDQALRVFRVLPNDPVPKATRVTVYMLTSPEAVGKLAGDKFAAGFYIGRASGPVAFVPRRAGNGGDFDLSTQAILFHEYAHHLMYSVFSNSAFPAWMIEGWAEFHATAKINKDGSVQFGLVPAYRAWGLLTTNPLPLERILAADTPVNKLKDEQREAIYGRGWALIHFLTFDQVRKGQISKYVAAINSGMKPADAAVAAFGDIAQLHKDLEKFINGGRVFGMTIPAARLTVGEVTLRKLTPGEVATMDVRIRSKRGVDEKSAPPVYADAKKAAAPFPNDPAAQMVLAEAAYDADDYAGSEAAADRAIAADPRAIDAYLYKAMSRMEIAKAKDDHSRETWRAIRVSIAAANKIDPDDPEPLTLYFRSFVDNGQAPTESAKAGLFRAFELAPFDSELRVNAAQLLIRDGEPQLARRLLMPLAYDPHGGALAQAATGMIAEIDKHAAEAPKPDATAPPKAATN